MAQTETPTNNWDPLPNEMEYFKYITSVAFPNMVYAFAYGSAAIPQQNYNSSNSLLDLIFVVRNAEVWHDLALARFDTHYAFPDLRLIRRLQPMGAGIYYNTDVDFADRRIKYGVVEWEDYLDDLLNWRYLYLAGRLHKPVVEILPPLREDQAIIDRVVEFNRLSAIKIALLMTSQRTSMDELLHNVVKLSYLGDFRMGLAEHPRKIENIVAGQYDTLVSIYKPHLDALGLIADFDGRIKQDDTSLWRMWLTSGMPSNLLNRINCNQIAAASLPTRQRAMEKAIGSIIRMPAIKQAAKGIITAGPRKSLNYAMAKLMKRII